ncbi:methyltransferase domain-containing protein [uncultured Rothia sp.]|uniref:methyltransferase domain-containing protein n=1 Tax=uncultured Rothia sp. TaxID=316088 RepID=UPI00321776BA
MGVPYTHQLKAKDDNARALLTEFGEIDWLEPVGSAESQFRNKAKIVVAGSAQAPTLGIITRDGQGIDLSGCGLYEPAISQMMPVLRKLIVRAELTPYNIATRKGELKNILVTVSSTGESMLRFVVRSKKLLVAIRREIPRLQEQIPGLAVVTVNLLREPKAIVEGPEEIILTEQETLPMQLEDVTLHLRPQSFFQTNTAIAAALYQQGQQWIEQVEPKNLWDLYCGVGGFGLHAAKALGKDIKVTGIEMSTEAIESARRTARELNLENISFETADATDFALKTRVGFPELLLVNPPRRGIGEDLCTWIEKSEIKTVIYSSCNAVSLVQDLKKMPSLTPVAARVLDMFPQTSHYEVITLLERKVFSSSASKSRSSV